MTPASSGSAGRLLAMCSCCCADRQRLRYIWEAVRWGFKSLSCAFSSPRWGPPRVMNILKTQARCVPLHQDSAFAEGERNRQSFSEESKHGFCVYIPHEYWYPECSCLSFGGKTDFQRQRALLLRFILEMEIHSQNHRLPALAHLSSPQCSTSLFSVSQWKLNLAGSRGRLGRFLQAVGSHHWELHEKVQQMTQLVGRSEDSLLWMD